MHRKKYIEILDKQKNKNFKERLEFIDKGGEYIDN